jgi:hypothetical protein
MVIPTTTRSAYGRVLTITLVVIGVGLVGFFGLRAYRAYTRFQPDAPVAGMTDVEAIRGWMTLPYIARAYGVPEDALFAALALPKTENARLSVKQLVAKYDRDPQATRQMLQQVVREMRGFTPSGGAP